jgi:hypothetical protein
MGFSKLLSLALLGLQATLAIADKPVVGNDDSIVVDNVEDLPGAIPKSANLKVTASGSIAHSEIFGIKLVNNQPTQAILQFNNSEPAPVTIAFILGSLNDPKTDKVVRNLTTKAFDKQVPAGEAVSFGYSFAVEMHPQSLKLKIVAMVMDSKKAFYQVPVLTESVDVVEAPISIFDPQTIFLYLVLASTFGGTCYFIYSTWIVPLLPQKKPRSGKHGKRHADTHSGGAAGDSSATATGSKGYDESWIPPQHLNKPEAKRVRGGTPKTKARG